MRKFSIALRNHVIAWLQLLETLFLVGHPGGVNWIKLQFWTGVGFCDLGQQGDLYKNKKHSCHTKLLNILKIYHCFRDLYHPCYFVPYGPEPLAQLRIQNFYPSIVNTPGIAGAILQTPLSLINSVCHFFWQYLQNTDSLKT